MVKVTDEEIIIACDNSDSMSEAARKLGIGLTTLKLKGEKLGCYKPNQGRKGLKGTSSYKYTLEEVYSGVGFMKSATLKLRLYKAGLKENVCDKCGISEWMDKPITCELHHIDGNPKNNSFENLSILCPNCHTQTDNYGNKKRFQE